MLKTIRAIYENGVFRPMQPVPIPEHCTVEFEPRVVVDGVEVTDQTGVYALLSERFESGESDVAEGHDEHL